jgi:hypothetical protein
VDADGRLDSLERSAIVSSVRPIVGR